MKYEVGSCSLNDFIADVGGKGGDLVTRKQSLKVDNLRLSGCLEKWLKGRPF
jgi:hypothetical protein